MSGTDENTPPPRGRRRLRRGICTLAAIVAIWVAGDFIYAAVIAYRYRAWEANIQRDADGVREGCKEFAVGEGATAILMVHGINDSPACYREMADSLASHGFHCRVMRMPGFAEPLDRYANSDRKQWIGAVKRELESLRKNHDSVIVVAHSLGGAVVIQLLSDASNAADAAVLLAPAVNVASDRSPLLTPAAWHGLANRLLIFTSATESPFGLDAKVANNESYPYRTPFTPRAIFDETFALIEENNGRAGEFKTPLLMILSPDDVVIDVDAARSFFERVGSHPKMLWEVDDTGHSMTVDHRWPALVERITEFARFVDGADEP